MSDVSGWRVGKVISRGLRARLRLEVGERRLRRRRVFGDDGERRGLRFDLPVLNRPGLRAVDGAAKPRRLHIGRVPVHLRLPAAVHPVHAAHPAVVLVRAEGRAGTEAPGQNRDHDYRC